MRVADGAGLGQHNGEKREAGSDGYGFLGTELRPRPTLAVTANSCQDGCLTLSSVLTRGDVPQCGYCQSGMVLAATSLLTKTPKPTDADIDAAMSNICRCGTYGRVRAAVHSAADMMAKGK